MRNWLHISHSEKRRGLDRAKIRWSKERELVFFLFLLLAPVDLILIAWHWSNIPLCIAERLLGCSAVCGCRRVWQTGTWEVDEDCHPARMTALFCDCDETSPFCTGCSKPIRSVRLLFQDGLYVGFPRVWGIVVKACSCFFFPTARLCSSLNWTLQQWKNAYIVRQICGLFLFFTSKPLCEDDHREFQQQPHIDPKPFPVYCDVTLQSKQVSKETLSNQCRLSQSLMNIINMLSVGNMQLSPSALRGTKVQSVRSSDFTDVWLHKRESSLVCRDYV